MTTILNIGPASPGQHCLPRRGVGCCSFTIGLSYDFGAWNYLPALPRWSAMDPLAEKYYAISPYVYCADNPVNLVDEDGKDGVLIVFPDYDIHVGDRTLDDLGHAGVLLIDRNSGYTRYYEYGRYDKDNKGVVRNRKIPNVKIGDDGKPTEESLNRVLESISKQAGQGGRIEGAYVESDEFELMKTFAEERIKENDDPNRKKYSLLWNNCATFAKDVLLQDKTVKKEAPLISNPSPRKMIKQYQKRFSIIVYNPKRGTNGIN